MIKLKLMSPLPEMLGMTRDSKTLRVELPWEGPVTLGQCIQRLAGAYPGLAARLEREGSDAVLGGLLFSLDKSVLDGPERMDTSVPDNCELLVFLPYAGG